jgi:hypothetical protein
MSRLFTFGCSFTNYRWNTWADCLAPEFDEFQNWGQSGAGNEFIFNSVMEADQRQHFGADDTVIVCWTTATREDRYIDGRWHTLGNMFTCPIYDKDYLKTHVDEHGLLIKTLAYIKSVKTLLENRPRVHWKFLSVSDIESLNIYQDVVDSILPSYQKVLFLNGWPNRNGDPHPSPEEHLQFVDAVLPGWVTKESTRVKIQEESINLNKDPHKSGMTKVTRL